MPFINRFTTTTNGAITITGNTLGLSKSTTGTLTPGTADAIGAFITTNTSVITAVGWGSIVNLANNENLTLDWTLNSSSAQLNILPNSRILYAELIWGTSYYLGLLPIENVTASVNNNILFTVPGGVTSSISLDSATNFDDGNYYSHSANVTSLINGSGTYTVGRVPGALSTSDVTGAYAGWTLIVVYENDTLPMRNMTVFAGAERVASGATVDTTISGFSTPAFGPLNARILVSAIEGDANRAGDFMQFGRNTSNLTKLYGPNNYANPPNTFDNFFNSGINNGNPNSANVGTVDTTGTFGSRNQSPSTLTNNTAGRQGWDITNVSGSNALVNSQTSAVVRFATQGDVYIPNGIAVQIDVASPIINITKSTTNSVIYSGEIIGYTLTVVNSGTLTTNNGLIVDSVPIGTTLNVGSINVVGATGPVVNNSNSSTLSINVGSIGIGQTVTITYTIQTSIGTTFPVTNFADIQYDFTPVAGGPIILEQVQSNTVTTNGVRVTQNKSVSNNEAVTGDIITYTVFIDNTQSSASITGVSILDALQAGTTYVANSTVIGGNAPINADPNVGISLGTISAYSSQTVKFNVLVTSPPAISPIINTANINFTVAGTTRTQNTNATNVNIVSPDFIVVKSVDKLVAEGGDLLTYTTVITNTGNIQLNNLIFNDSPPINTTYNGNGVTINGILYPLLNPNSPIDLLAVPLPISTFPLQPGESVTIAYSATITSAPSGGRINNTSSITAQYNVGSEQRTDTNNSNTVSTEVFTIGVNKSVNRAYVEIGDTYTYTSTITSTTPGIYPDNIIFIDDLPSNITLVPGSIIVNGATVSVDNSKSTQINLDFGNIFPNNPIVISFNVLVGSGTTGTLLNTSIVEIEGIPTNSNTVSTQVSPLTVTKSTSENFITVGQNYNYTVTIDNRGNNAPLTQVYVYDPLQPETTYVSNSTIIGVNLPINANPGILPGINIGTVPANTLLTVRFSVILNSFPSQNPILNTVTINYRLDNVAKSKTSNETQVTTRIANIAINKQVDKQYSDVGEILTYTIITTNTGNVNANNIVLSDVITPGTTFNIGSISSTASFTGTNLYTGITFTNPIIPGGTVTTTFTVTINNSVPIQNPIINTAETTFNYIVDPADPPVSASISSNSVTTTVNTADLTSSGNLTKETNMEYADIGDIITYTISATNTGNVNANNVKITDPIPVGTSFIDGSISSNIPFTGTNPQLGISLTNPILPGETAIITFQVTVNSIPSPNPTPNQASINYTYTINPSNPNGISDSGSSNIVNTQVNTANIGYLGNFTKSVDKSIVQIGDVLTYTLTIANTGTTSATNVVVTDILPNGTAFVPGSITSTVPYSGSNPATGITLTNPIIVGSTVIITYNLTVVSIPNPNPIRNTANIAYRYIVDPITPIIVNATATSNEADTAVSQAVLIGPDNFIKTIDLNYAKVGDIVTYTITVENTGTVTATDITVTDTVPSGTTLVPGSVSVSVPSTINIVGSDISIDIAQINPLDPLITITFQVTVDTIPTQNPILNFAGIEYSYIGPSGVVTENGFTDIVSTQVNTADLISNDNFTKLVDKNYLIIGDIVTYYLSIINTGNIAAVNVFIQDIMPNGLTFISGSLVLNNPHTGNDIETGITLTNPIQPNEVVDITFQAEATSIPVPNPTDNSASISYDYTVDPAAPNPDVSVNGTSNIVSTQIEISELNTTKSADIAYADIGDTINYTITVENIGTINASNVIITDLLPNEVVLSGPVNVSVGSTVSTTSTSITVNITSPMLPGASVIITFPVLVTTIPVPNPIENNATVNYRYTADPANPNGATGTEIAGPAETLVNHADLISPGNFTKSVNKEYADIGDVLTYTIRVDNTGTTNADNVIITDLLPNGTNLVGTVSVSVPSNITTTLTSVIVEITNFISPTATPIIITYQVSVVSIPTPNPIVNTADITYDYIIDSTDPLNPIIGTGLGTTETVQTVINYADLVSPGNFIKSASVSYADIGDVITYTITITNTGSTAATTTVVTDPIENGTTFTPGSIASNVPVTGTVPTTGIFINNPIQPGDTVIITFQVAVTSVPTSNPIENIANINYSYIVDPINNIIENNSGSTLPVTTQVNFADLTSPGNFIKNVDRLYSDISGTITYTIIVKNTGTVSANNVVVVDPIPQGVSIIPPVTVTVPSSVTISATEITIIITNPIEVTDPDITITITANVISIPPTSNVVDQAYITYDYIVNPMGPVLGNDSGNTNQVSTRINDADLNTSFIKSVDKEYASVGDILTYTITTRNTGNTRANNVIITDVIQPGTTFNVGSTSANVEIIGDNPELGIRIVNSVSPTDQPIVITYQVTVVNIPNPNTITNTADIIYDYIIDPITGEIDIHTGTTAPVITEVNFADLTSPGNFNKDVDFDYADIGDVLTYTLTITNTGNVEATSVIITDILSTDIELVPGSITSSSNIIGINPETGIIIINPVLPGDIVTVSYRATIVSLPDPNIIENTANIDYRFTLDPSMPNANSNSGISTTANTEINNANLVDNFTKSVSQRYADIGDILTYTITTTNTGNTSANLVTISDPLLPIEVTFVLGSITSNVNILGNDPVTGISITDPILPGTTVWVSFRVVVDTIPTPNQLSNTANISYRYTVDPSNINGSSEQGITRPVITDVFTADLTSAGNFTKTVDKEYADIGDVLTYTIIMINTGNVSANNVFIRDILPSRTTFINGSIVSALNYTGNNLQSGITLTESIVAGGSVTINYQVRVVSIPTENPIENTANVQYTYTVDPRNPDGASDTGVSTIAITEVNNANLISEGNFVKGVSSEYTFVGDILNYTFIIRNTGNVSANNVQIIDVIPPGTSFVPPIISSVGFIGDNPESGIIFSTPILAGDIVNMSFSVRVDEIPNPNPILNIANINYTYTVDPQNIDGVSESGISNQVSSLVICEEKQIEECLFKLQESVNINSINTQISTVTATVLRKNIDKTNVIYKQYGPPSINIRGYNLYLDIKFNYKIIYNYYQQAEFNEILKISIFIPKDMADEIVDGEVNIENTEFFIDGSKKGFLVNTIILVCAYINS